MPAFVLQDHRNSGEEERQLMQLPLQITFRNMESSVAIESRVRERASKLDTVCDHIMGCRVVIEAPHRHHHKGKLYHVRIDLTVPQGELVVSREPKDNHAHEDVYVAIRDAFKAAERQLEDYVRRQRGVVKTHESPYAEGRVTKLFPEEGYGILITAEGLEVYFHRNSVVEDGFGKLEVGHLVRFIETSGEKGPQASTVTIA